MTKLRRSHLIIKLRTNIAHDNVHTQARDGKRKTTCCPSCGTLFGSFSILVCSLRGALAALRPLQDELQRIYLALFVAQLCAGLPELRLQLEELAQLLGHLRLGVPQLLLQQRDLPRLLAHLRGDDKWQGPRCDYFNRTNKERIQLSPLSPVITTFLRAPSP